MFDILGAQFAPPITQRDRRFTDLAHRFPQDRSLMLVAVRDENRIVGGALAFRTSTTPAGEGHATLRTIAVVPAERGNGLGRRLMDRIEAEAVLLGVGMLALGAGPEVRGFYRRLGYDGRSRMRKALPGSTVTRYGQTEDRQRALAELRARRAGRVARRDTSHQT